MDQTSEQKNTNTESLQVGEIVEVDDAEIAINSTVPEIINPETANNENSADSIIDIFWSSFKAYSYLGLPRALSFTFSIEMIVVIWFLNALNSDEDHLTATTWAILIINAVVTLGLSPLYALNPILNALLGEINSLEDSETKKNLQDKFSKIVKQAYILGSIFTPFIMLPLFFSGYILENILGQAPEVAQATQTFTRWFLPALIALQTRLVSEEVIFAFNQQKFAMGVGLFNLSIGMVAGWYLAKYGMIGEPLGEIGIAIGCVIESFMTASSFAACIALREKYNEYRFFTDWTGLHKHYKNWINILKVGSTILLTNLSEFALPFAAGLFASWNGKTSGAVWNPVTQMNGIVGFLRYAFGFTVCKEVSVAVGKHQINHANQLGIHGLITTLIYTLPPAFLLVLWCWFYDLGNAVLQQKIKIAMPIAFGAVIADIIRFNSLQYCRGVNDNFIASFLSSGSLLAGVSASYFIGNVIGLDVEGITASYSISYSVSAILVTIRAISYALHLSKDKLSKPKHANWSPKLFQNCFKSRVTVVDDEIENATEQTQQTAAIQCV